MIQELKKTYIQHLISWSVFLILTAIPLFIQGEFELENFFKAFFFLILLGVPLTTWIFYWYKNIYRPKQMNSLLDKLEPITAIGFERDGLLYSKTHKGFHFSISFNPKMDGGNSLMFLTPIIGEQEKFDELLAYLKNTEITLMDESPLLVYSQPLIFNKIPSNTEISKKLEIIIESTKKFNIEPGLI